MKPFRWLNCYRKSKKSLVDKEFFRRYTEKRKQIHKVKAGDTVGYGATYKCDEDTWIGTVPIGYADGYPRCLSNRGEVLIGGRRYKVAGRVCMDQVMIELGHETDVKVGDEVVLIGRQGGDEITVSDIARLADTHPDEISCQLTQRIPRIYCNKY